MNRIILFTACCIIALNLSAQRTTEEQPYGLSTGIKAILQEIIVLPAPDIEEIRKENLENDQSFGPVPYAVGITVNYSLENSGVWQLLDNGGKIWHLKVKMPGALSTNVHYDQFWLPEGAKFFVYSEDTKQSIGAITSEFIEGSRGKPVQFATALIYGETVVFEYYQPASVKESPIIHISRIDYGYQYINNPFIEGVRSFGDAKPCNININCQEGNSWKVEKHAVALAIYPNGNLSYTASCALINNTNNDYTPYVLTADHCFIESSTNTRIYDALPLPGETSNASGWIFYWDYEHPGCANGPAPSTTGRTSSGAIVVANNSISDFALLRINPLQDPRFLPAVWPYYLGWDRSGGTVISGAGIHHPSGDVKKISFSGSIQNHSSSLSWKFGPSSPANSHWKVSITNGAIEGGSSGSPFINNFYRVIGQLHGGDTGCAPLTDYYGKFNVSWTGSTGSTPHSDKERRLDFWLAPGLSSPPQTLDGILKPVINGPSLICFGSTGTFTVTNPPPGHTWGCSANLTPVPGNPGKFTATGKGGGWVSINYGAEEFVRFNVALSTRFESIYGPENVAPGSSTYMYSAYFSGATPTSYLWDITGVPSSTWYSYWSSGNMLYVNFYEEATYTVTARAYDACGHYDSGYIYVYAGSKKNQEEEKEDEEEFFIAYPNPANDVLYIEINNSARGLNGNPAYNIRLYSMLGSMVLSTTTQNNTVQLNISNLPNGIYFLHVFDGVNSVPAIKQIAINH